MKFAFFFGGLLYCFFAVGGLLWPNPDGSLDKKNRDGLSELMRKTKTKGISGCLYKIFAPIVLALYLPFYKPVLGLIFGVVMLLVGGYVV